MQKMLLRVFLWENCFLNVAIPVFVLWRGQKWKHCCGTAGCPEEEVSVPMQGPLSPPACIQKQRGMHQEPRTSHALVFSAVSSAHFVAVNMGGSWGWGFPSPRTVAAFWVTSYQKIANAELETTDDVAFYMASSLFLVCEGKKVEVKLHWIIVN